MNCYDAQKNSSFDGASFVNVIILVVFISLLIFGSTNLPDVSLDTTTF